MALMTKPGAKPAKANEWWNPTGATNTEDRVAAFRTANTARGVQNRQLAGQMGADTRNTGLIGQAYNQAVNGGRAPGSLADYTRANYSNFYAGGQQPQTAMLAQSSVSPGSKELPNTGAQTTSLTPPANLPAPGTTGGTAGGGLAGATSGTGGNTNTAPTTTPGANPVIENNVPGTTNASPQQQGNDHYNWLLNLMYARDTQLGGAGGAGGNNIDSAGNYSQPDWVRDDGMLANWNSGANTNATTRQMQEGETVEGRLGGLMRRGNALNDIAMSDAREQAAAAGMLGGSTAAAGAALRASRQTMLPIAQQDAAWEGQTARDNMDALNRDALSDQDARTGLIGQNLGIRANLYESASDRQWRAKENNQNRIWQSVENNLGWLRNSSDREDNQNFTQGMERDRQDWDAWQNGLNRDLTQWQQNDDQEFRGNESELDRQQNRRMAYFQMLFGRESQFAESANAIYSNPNLTPAQQTAAVANMRDFYTAAWRSFNETLAQGVPEIFTAPYEMAPPPQPGAPGAPGAPGPNTGLIPGTAPPTNNEPPTGATQPITTSPTDRDNPNLEAPLIRRDNAGRPVYATLDGFDEEGRAIWTDGEGGPRIP